MGQKVNPHGLRVGIIKNWDSRWYVKDEVFGDTLVSDYNVRKFLKKELYDAGIKISLNPDDGGIFGTHTGKEHRISAEKFGFTKAEMLDITLCAIENSFADVKTRKQVKENIYKKMSAEDRKEMKDLADNAKNPFLKKRLETRVSESEKVAKKMEIQKRRAKTMKTMKATRLALLAQKNIGR